jgi:uncharacterized membrane protein (DUF106 family)
MLETLTRIVMAIADPAFGWILALPKDVALFVIGIGTAAILTVVRLFTTDQEVLGRCHRDKKRLKALIKEAKARKDKEAVARHRAVKNLVANRAMKYEGKPLLASLLPIALLGTWCFLRMDCIPPKADEPVKVVAYFPVSASGNVAYMVPLDNVLAETGWVQEVRVQELTDKDKERGVVPDAEAVWSLRAAARPEPYNLQIRFKTGTYEQKLLVGQRAYEWPVAFYGPDDPIVCTQVMMKQVKLFGLVPGIPWLLMPPWLVAYFVIAVPFVSIVKRVTHIY